METAALPLCYYPKMADELLRLFVGRTLTAVRAELHLLQALGRRLLVPSRRVVTVLALSASQYREITLFQLLQAKLSNQQYYKTSYC